MSDALTPLRHTYGVEPAGPAPVTGERGHAELQMLRQMRAVLDGAPRPQPSAAAVAAVLAHADPLAPVRHVYEGAGAPPPSAELALLRTTAEALDRARRPARPEAAVADAVLARAAEASALDAGPALAPSSPVEAAVLAQSEEALVRLPAARPSAEAVAAVLATAEAASAPPELAAVRALYAGGPALDSPEATLLHQSRAAVEQALRAGPPPRPSAEAVAAVLARAAEASSLGGGPALPASSPVEAAVLEQSLAALDRLPTGRPAPAALAAVRARAAAAARPPRRASDRAAAWPGRTRRTGVWAGAGTLLMAALVAVFVLPDVLSTAEEVSPAVATLADVVPAVPAAPSPGPASEAAPEAEAPSPAPTGASALAAAAALAAAVPPVSTPSAEDGPTAAPAARAALADRTPPPTPTSPPPAWDAGDDVRALSLRLQELDRETQGLAWDAPAESFDGASGARTPASTPGVRVVREGAVPPPAAAPARADSSDQQR